MQQQLTEFLGHVAPYMIVVAQVGVGILAIAVVALLLRLLVGRFNWLLKLSSFVLIFLGLLFLSYAVLLMLAGLPEADNYIFYGKPFWVVATVLLVPGAVFRFISALRPTR